MDMRIRMLVGIVCAASMSTLLVARPFQGRDRGAESPAPQVDKIFAKWNSPSTPGCAVEAAVDGKPVIAKGYGMADLEHDVKITPESIFEDRKSTRLNSSHANISYAVFC